MRALRGVAALLVAVALGACASRAYVKAYPGPELTMQQVALLKPVIGVSVLSIDGDPAYAVKSAQPLGYLDVEIAVLPGPHKVQVMLDTGSQMSLGSVTLDFHGIAGHKYLINYTWEAYTFHPRIEDRTDRPHTWCAQKGAAESEKGC